MYFIFQIKKQIYRNFCLYHAPLESGDVPEVTPDEVPVDIEDDAMRLQQLERMARPQLGDELLWEFEAQRERIRDTEMYDDRSDDAPISEVQSPISPELYTELQGNLDINMYVPEGLEAEIMSEVIANLETEWLTPEEVQTQLEGMYTEVATRLKIREFESMSLADRTRILEWDEDTLSIGDEITRISQETGIDRDLLARAMAQNFQNFGIGEDGTPLNEVWEQLTGSITSLAGTIQQQLEEYRRENPDAEYDMSDPQQVRDFYEAALWSDVVSSLGEDSTISTGPTQSYTPSYAPSSPARTGIPASPTGPGYSSEWLSEWGEAHVWTIELNPEFYGQQLVNDFNELEQRSPEVYESALHIIEAFDTAAGSEESWWGWPIMRNAVNSVQRWENFSDSRCFLAHDLGTQTSGVYDPRTQQVTFIPSRHGRGIGNVPESYTTPLGSFTMQNTHMNNPNGRSQGQRYNYCLSVHGMEPMRQDMVVRDRAEARSYDPSVWNENSNGRAILIHDGLRTTLGCSGYTTEWARLIAESVRAGWGEWNFEVFISTGTWVSNWTSGAPMTS